MHNNTQEWAGCLRGSDVKAMTEATTRHEFNKALLTAIRYATSKSYTEPGTYQFGQVDPLFEMFTFCDKENEICKHYFLPTIVERRERSSRDQSFNSLVLAQFFVVFLIFLISIIFLYFRKRIFKMFNCWIINLSGGFLI